MLSNKEEANLNSKTLMIMAEALPFLSLQLSRKYENCF